MLLPLLFACAPSPSARPAAAELCDGVHNCLVGSCEVTNPTEQPQRVTVSGTAFPTAAPGSAFGTVTAEVELAPGQSRRVEFGFRLGSYWSEDRAPRDCADLACVTMRGYEFAFDCEVRPQAIPTGIQRSGWEVLEQEPGRGVVVRSDADKQWPALALIGLVPGSLALEEAMAAAQRAARGLLPDQPQKAPVGSADLFEVTRHYDQMGEAVWSPVRTEPFPVRAASTYLPYTLLSDNVLSVDLTAAVRRCGQGWALLAVAETQPLTVITDLGDQGWSTREAVGWTEVQPGFLGALDCEAEPVVLWPEG